MGGTFLRLWHPGAPFGWSRGGGPSEIAHIVRFPWTAARMRRAATARGSHPPQPDRTEGRRVPRPARTAGAEAQDGLGGGSLRCCLAIADLGRRSPDGARGYIPAVRNWT